MRRAATFLALVSLFLGSLPADDAFADIVYTDAGTDADDATGPGIADVEFTRRTVSVNKSGHRSIRLRIRAYEPLGAVWSGATVFLDYRGGPRRDAQVTFVNIEGPPYCGLNFPNGSGATFRALQERRTFSCSFRLALLKPTKRVRWRVVSPSLDTIDPPDTDRAPNSGWYV